MFWGPVLLVDVLKVEVLDVGSKFFTRQGEVGSFKVPSWLQAAVAEVRFMARVWSHPVLPILIWVFSCFAQWIWASPLVSGFLFRGNCFMCSWRFGVLIEGGKFRSLLCHHLGPELKIYENLSGFAGTSKGNNNKYITCQEKYS